MKRHRFRIISYTKDDVPYFDTKVKTWFGWISFAVFYRSDILHVLKDPSTLKSVAYERINQYCQIRGYKKEEIEITEVNREPRG